MTNRTLLVLSGSLLLAAIVLLLAGSTTVSREPSAHSKPYNFTTVHIADAPKLNSPVIDEPQVYREPSSTPPSKREKVSVPSVKPRAEKKPPANPATKLDRAGIGNDRAVFGKASYYCCTNGYSSGEKVGAACSKLRDAMGPSWRGQTVTVSRGDQQVTVKLVDWCGSKDKLIDLHPGAFKELGPLERGVLRVTVRW